LELSGKVALITGAASGIADFQCGCAERPTWIEKTKKLCFTDDRKFCKVKHNE